MNKQNSPVKASAPQPTPMIAQFLDIKAAHQDYLLFYRMGDFYELFFEDALEAAAALDITLTHRGQHMGKNIPMCGVPIHAAEPYLERLIRKGYKVAVCEQTEDPAAAKKRGAKAVVRREVVRLVTAGTLSEDSLLDARTHNFLAAICTIADEIALAWLDMSTGEFEACMVHNMDDLFASLARLTPREILLPEHMRDIADTLNNMTRPPLLTDIPPSLASAQAAERHMADYFPHHIQDLQNEFSRAARAACGTLIGYLRFTQIDHMPHLKLPRLESTAAHMHIDAATRANLELTHTLGGETKGSLLAAIDKTITGAGARVLAARLSAPLMQKSEIENRHGAIACLLEQEQINDDIRHTLKTVPDMARSLSRLSLDRGGPRDLQAIAQGISGAQKIAGYLHHIENDNAEIRRIRTDLTTELSGLIDVLGSALKKDLPLLARDGDFIRSTYDASLEKARTMRDESKRIIAGLQQKYADATGIKSLKIKYNAVLGYHIDVPSAHGDKLINPPFNQDFIHRQTLASAARFSTKELGELASQISRAAEMSLGIEQEIFIDLKTKVLTENEKIRSCADALSALDVTCGLAVLARTYKWVRPLMYDDMRFLITQGRHPVVEHALQATQYARFIANDCALDATTMSQENTPRLGVLTGPNMAGKSTFLRQNALIAILAQMGSYVPAQAAHIGIIDRVFSRVGAADDLARGRSTFMVEMVETAAILTHAGAHSLVILDEIGRGTATFDGLSLAWAVAEYLHDKIKCRALFATHYHELTALAQRLDGLTNLTMRVKEHKGSLVFLHEVASGAADRSYGIHVAQLAGLPENVIKRAQTILTMLEENRNMGGLAPDLDGLPLFTEYATDEDPKKDRLRETLSTLNPDTLTPREAHDWLYRLLELMREGND